MDAAELRELLSPEGLRLLDEVGPIDSTADVVRIVSRLRADGYGGGLVAAVLGQARLRATRRATCGPRYAWSTTSAAASAPTPWPSRGWTSRYGPSTPTP